MFILVEENCIMSLSNIWNFLHRKLADASLDGAISWELHYAVKISQNWYLQNENFLW